VNTIEGVLTAVAQSQAQTSAAIVQLTASVAALVQHAGIAIALPPAPPPTPPPQAYAAIAAASAPVASVATSETETVMEATAAGASVANTGLQTARTTAGAIRSVTPTSTSVPGYTGAAPSAEMDLNDDSMPVPDEAPVSRRTRLSLALTAMLTGASGTTQGTVEGPATWSTATRRVTWQDEHEWEDEYDATTDDERDDSNYVLFDGDDGDDITGDEDDTSQHEGESSDEYEARLNGIVPPPAHFCCRPVFF
jgi:hypothetical protein